MVTAVNPYDVQATSIIAPVSPQVPMKDVLFYTANPLKFPSIGGLEPLYNLIIENQKIISRAEHVIVNFCNKPLKRKQYSRFQKSIMLKIRL